MRLVLPVLEVVNVPVDITVPHITSSVHPQAFGQPVVAVAPIHVHPVDVVEVPVDQVALRVDVPVHQSAVVHVGPLLGLGQVEVPVQVQVSVQVLREAPLQIEPLYAQAVVHVHPLLLHVALVQQPLQAPLLLDALLQDPVGVEAEVELQAVAHLAGAVIVPVQAVLVEVQPQVHVPVAQSVPQRPERVDGALEVAVVGVVLQQHRRIVEIQPPGAVVQPRLQFNGCRETVLHRHWSRAVPRTETVPPCSESPERVRCVWRCGKKQNKNDRKKQRSDG